MKLSLKSRGWLVSEDKGLVVVLSYFFYQAAYQTASYFTEIGIRDTAQQLPPFGGGTGALLQWGIFSFPLQGNYAAVPPYQHFYGWELQGENGFRNLHMLHTDLFFLLVRGKKNPKQQHCRDREVMSSLSEVTYCAL